MKGILKICPISSDIPYSHDTCRSFKNSIKNMNVNIINNTSPKYNPALNLFRSFYTISKEYGNQHTNNAPVTCQSPVSGNNKLAIFNSKRKIISKG
jgi:hypothetical protein